MALPIETLTWTLGDRLAKARRHVGLEQAEMAKRLGVSRALVSKWERDGTEPSVTQARRWAEECGITMEELLTFGYKPDFGVVAETAGQMEFAFLPEPQLVAV